MTGAAPAPVGGAAALKGAYEAFHRGDLAAAERSSTEVCEKASEHSAAWLLRGLIQMERFRYEEAIELFDRALAIEPAPWSHAKKGTCYLRLRQLQPALSATLAALHLKPDFADALVNVATILHGMEDFTQALSALEQADSLHPNDPRTLSRFAATYAHLGEYERAEEFLGKAAGSTKEFPYYGVVSFRKSLFEQLEAEREGMASAPRGLLEAGSPEAGDYVVTTVCNAAYFYRYGANFVNSYAQNAARDNTLHLHILDPDPEFEPRLRALLERV